MQDGVVPLSLTLGTVYHYFGYEPVNATFGNMLFQHIMDVVLAMSLPIMVITLPL